MNPLPSYLQALEYEDAKVFPEEALNEAVQRREEAIPHLLQSLAWACEHPYAENENGDVYSLHIYALFLLASFREPRAYPLVLRMFQHPEADAIVGDLEAEVGERILASVCGHQDVGPIQQAIEDSTQDELLRATMIESLGVLTQSGIKPREETIAYYRTLFRGGLGPGDAVLWNCFVATCADLRMTELLPEIRDLYRTNPHGEHFDPLTYVESIISEASPPPERFSLIGNPVDEVQAWERMGEEMDEILDEELGSLRALDVLGLGDRVDDEEMPTDPYLRPTPKVGRNDQCPCGSGKKFKKCCGAIGDSGL